MKTILILTLDGGMDSSLSITTDTLRTAQLLLANAGQSQSVRVLVAGHKKTVRTGSGLRLSVDMTFKDVLKSALRPDWIVIPGCGLVRDTDITAKLVSNDAIEMIKLLQSMENVKIAASCSSVFLLAQTGLLNGRHVTMTWWLAPLFRACYPQIKLDEAKMLVRDGLYLTAGAAFSQLDLVLSIITDTMGDTITHLCSRYLLIDQRPSQARYMIQPMMQAHIQQADPTMIMAERWIDEHLATPISITGLSAQLAMSSKTFSRRIVSATGMSPIKFIQRRRLIRASYLLETTSLSIETIAAQVGYQDGTALRKLIKREFGTTPGAMR